MVNQQHFLVYTEIKLISGQQSEKLIKTNKQNKNHGVETSSNISVIEGVNGRSKPIGLTGTAEVLLVGKNSHEAVVIC